MPGQTSHSIRIQNTGWSNAKNPLSPNEFRAFGTPYGRSLARRLSDTNLTDLFAQHLNSIFTELALDIVSPARRSQIMGRIAGKGTKPEVAVRRAAHRLGYRFRLHRRELPGSPDLVFAKRQTVIFVHGCFWHRHENCRLCYTPKSNIEFWRKKFENNVARDHRVQIELERLGWRVAVIWECETADIGSLSRRLKGILG